MVAPGVAFWLIAMILYLFVVPLCILPVFCSVNTTGETIPLKIENKLEQKLELAYKAHSDLYLATKKADLCGIAIHLTGIAIAAYRLTRPDIWKFYPLLAVMFLQNIPFIISVATLQYFKADRQPLCFQGSVVDNKKGVFLGSNRLLPLVSLVQLTFKIAEILMPFFYYGHN